MCHTIKSQARLLGVNISVPTPNRVATSLNTLQNTQHTAPQYQQYTQQRAECQDSMSLTDEQIRAGLERILVVDRVGLHADQRLAVLVVGRGDHLEAAVAGDGRAVVVVVAATCVREGVQR
jgi:hypothetical protein